MRITIKKYDELNKTIKQWSVSNIRLLIIHSGAGTGKTTTLKNTLKDFHRITSHSTPLSLYKECYEHNNKVLWFDDVDELLKNNLTVSILKQLCDDAGEVSYYSTTQQLEDVPQTFSFKGRVIVTLNDYRFTSKNLLALEDRGLVVYFKPDRQEIINKMMSYENPDEEIISFLKDFKGVITLRTYDKAREFKQQGFDWRDLLNKSVRSELDDKEKEFLEIEKEFKGFSVSVKLLYWEHSRADYFRVKARLKKKKLL